MVAGFFFALKKWFKKNCFCDRVSTVWLYKTCFGNFSLTYLSWCPMQTVLSSVFQGQCMNSLLDHDGELVCAKEREGNSQSTVTAIQITIVLHYSKLCMGSKSVCMLLCVCVCACAHVCDWWLLIKCYSPLSWAGGGDSSVVRAPDSWLKGRGFESLLEWRENFRLQGRLSVLTLISVSVPPPCYHSST